jgi:hypothetical protein
MFWYPRFLTKSHEFCRLRPLNCYPPIPQAVPVVGICTVKELELRKPSVAVKNYYKNNCGSLTDETNVIKFWAVNTAFNLEESTQMAGPLVTTRGPPVNINMPVESAAHSTVSLLETMSPRYPLYVGTGAGLNVI